MNQPLPPIEQFHRLLTDLLHTQTATSDIAQQLLVESRHFRSDWAAHMTPNLAPYSLLGKYLASLHNGNLLSAELYPALQHAENELADWLKQGFGLPYLQFTHGGSYSNLEALWQAKQYGDSNRKRVYASQASHYSIKKACHILDLEYCEINTDATDKICIDLLQQACEQQPPLLICATIGTTASGAIDPVGIIADIARQTQSWLHVDACWAGSSFLLPENQHGLAVADTISFDPHKTLFVPKPCSILLSHHQQLAEHTDYLESAPVVTLSGSYGGELFLPLWLNLKLLGADWFYEKTRYRLQQAEQFATYLEQQPGWQVSHHGTGIVLFDSPKNLDELIKYGIFSKVKYQQQQRYRAVFASYSTSADSLIEQLRHYF